MSPLKFMLFALAVLAGLVVVYGLFVESGALKLPLIVSGLAVVSISLGLLGFALAGSAVSLGESGRGGRALVTAFVGGLFVLVAAGSLAAAIVLGILAGAA